jgi:hypothetical protein
MASMTAREALNVLEQYHPQMPTNGGKIVGDVLTELRAMQQDADSGVVSYEAIDGILVAGMAKPKVK